MMQFCFEDPEEVPAGLTEFAGNFVVQPLHQGKYAAKLTAGRFRDVALIRSVQTESLVTSLGELRHFCVVFASGAPVETRVNRDVIRYRGTTACVLNYDDYQPTCRLPQNDGVFVMNVFKRELHEYAAAMSGGTGLKPLRLPNRLPLAHPEGRAYRRCLNFLWSELELGSPTLNSDLVVEELEKTLLAAFLLAADPQHQLVEKSSGVASMDRAVDFIMAHLSESLSIGRIAAAAGAHAKTLQRAFHNEYGMSVMVFVQQRRLEQAHEQLLAADPDVSSVTDIALANGFGHLGRFSAMYHRRFGVYPSNTLRRS